MERPLKIVSHIVAWILGALFIYAGVIKVANPAAFLTDIESYHLLNYRFAVAVALFLPVLEILCGIGMFVRKFRPESRLILLLFTGVFIVALASAWVRGIDVSCGCFGSSEAKANYYELIGRDVLIMLGLWFVGRTIDGQSSSKHGSES